MNHVTKQELAQILHRVAYTLKQGAISGIDEIASELSDSDPIPKSSIPYWGEPFEPKPVIPADTPAWYSKWSNNKSGDIYKVIGLSNLSSTREDFPPTIIYERESDNTTWSRTLTSFMLKFKPV